jgi:L-lactate utilization protein LutB
MNCKEYRSRLEQEVRLQKKAADFRAQSDILREEILQKIEKERVSQAPTNLKVVVGGHTYLAESEEAAKALRNLFVDM